VLVVEDSLTIRKYLVEALRADPQIEVVGEADDGQKAIELCEKLRPDVISLDMMLPVLNGLAATEHIMAYFPTPILVVSASTNRGELFKTYEALAAGAVDVLEKPTGDSFGDEWESKYRRTIKMVSRIRVITHPRARLADFQAARVGLAQRGPVNQPSVSGLTGLSDDAGSFRCVAIGASTGGPGAVAHVLRSLPPQFPLPVLVVIHIASPFAVALTEWFGTVASIPVRDCVDGQLMPQVGQPGVIMAPPDRHLVLKSGRLWTTRDAERHFCRPSVDVLFESLAREMGHSVVACLLTGMGRDGATGLLAIKKAGGMTIAQDEASSVVYGMPRAAIELDAARRVLALDEIGPALLHLAQLSSAAD